MNSLPALFSALLLRGKVAPRCSAYFVAHSGQDLSGHPGNGTMILCLWKR